MHIVDENSGGLQAEMLAVIKSIYRHGWAQATSTNYSFRNPDGESISISRSGVDKEFFSAKDFMVVDADGQPLEGYRHIKPSAETLLHTMIYSEIPAANAVLHTHSIAGTVISQRYREAKAVTVSGLEILKGLKGITTHQTTLRIPVFNNSQDIASLSAGIRAAGPKDMYGFLLAAHGLYTWGETIAEAKRHLETLEFLFECVNTLDLYKQ